MGGRWKEGNKDNKKKNCFLSVFISPTRPSHLSTPHSLTLLWRRSNCGKSWTRQSLSCRCHLVTRLTLKEGVTSDEQNGSWSPPGEEGRRVREKVGMEKDVLIKMFD